MSKIRAATNRRSPKDVSTLNDQGGPSSPSSICNPSKDRRVKVGRGNTKFEEITETAILSWGGNSFKHHHHHRRRRRLPAFGSYLISSSPCSFFRPLLHLSLNADASFVRCHENHGIVNAVGTFCSLRTQRQPAFFVQADVKTSSNYALRLKNQTPLQSGPSQDY